jgi:hypothetical protein
MSATTMPRYPTRPYRRKSGGRVAIETLLFVFGMMLAIVAGVVVILAALIWMALP